MTPEELGKSGGNVETGSDCATGTKHYFHVKNYSWSNVDRYKIGRRRKQINLRTAAKTEGNSAKPNLWMKSNGTYDRGRC
jgi:hypothetical protein